MLTDSSAIVEPPATARMEPVRITPGILADSLGNIRYILIAAKVWASAPDCSGRISAAMACLEQLEDLLRSSR